MTLGQNFRRTWDVGVSSAITSAAVRQFLSDAADENVAALIEAQQAPRSFRRFVNGVENAPGNTVRVDGSGSIVFLFSNMAQAAADALAFAVAHSPVDSGDYARSWFFLVDGQPWTGTDLSQIPLGAEVTLTNHQPYHRKIDVGGMRMKVPPQIVEATRQMVLSRYPAIDAQRVFIAIPGAYVLKGGRTTLAGRQFTSGLSYDKRKKAYVQARTPKRTNRKDSVRGEQMTYPSLVMREIA